MSLFNTIVITNVNTKVLENKNILVLNDSMSFSERIIKARKYARLSQQELALRLGCSQGLISKIERGDQQETTLTVKISAICHVNPYWLDSGDGDMTDYLVTDPALKVAMQLMQEMPSYARQAAIKEIVQVKELIDQAQAEQIKK